MPTGCRSSRADPRPDARFLEYAVNYDLAQRKGVLENAEMAYGKAVANLSGNFQKRREGLTMNMRLLGKDMPVEDMKTLLPAFGVVLPKGASLEGGFLNADITASGPIDKMTIVGSTDISNTSLVGYDLAGKVAALAQMAGLPSDSRTNIEILSSSVRMTPDIIRINPVKLVVPAIGDLTGNGDINNSDQALNFRMKARLKTSGDIGQQLARYLGGSGENVTIPFFIRGTTSEPKFVPDLESTAGSILESQLSGQGDEAGESSVGKAIGDALKGLLGD